jgi:hypothetical protein
MSIRENIEKSSDMLLKAISKSLNEVGTFPFDGIPLQPIKANM